MFWPQFVAISRELENLSKYTAESIDELACSMKMAKNCGRNMSEQ